MRVLLKPEFYSGNMAVFELGKVEWLNFLRCPLTKQNKEDTPLFTYGNLVKCPEPGNARGFLHAIAGNIESYNAIQLDYDEFVTLDGFIREFKDQFAFWPTRHTTTGSRRATASAWSSRSDIRFPRP